jgi:hypothetical protein
MRDEAREIAATIEKRPGLLQARERVGMTD